jgi:hypothetical protein
MTLLLIVALLFVVLIGGAVVTVILVACFSGRSRHGRLEAQRSLNEGGNVPWVKLAALQPTESPSHVSCSSGAIRGKRTVASGWYVAGSEEAAGFVRQHAREGEAGENGMGCEVREIDEIWLPPGKRPD